MIIKVCAHCGKEFSVYPSRASAIYCSKPCHYADRTGPNNPKFTSVLVACDNCGKEFYQQPYLIQDGKGNYCSRQCASRHTASSRPQNQRTGRVVQCYNCSKKIYRIKSRLRKRNFCSPQCLGEYRKSKRVIIVCAYCARKRRVKPSYLTKGIKCCSVECAIRYSGETSLETLGYALLDVMEFDYLKQYRLGNFIPDAYIPSLKMAVLFDGDYWHDQPDHQDRDKRFNEYAQQVGVTVVRVRQSELKASLDILRTRIIEVGKLQPSEVPPISTLFVPPSNHGGDIQLPLDLLTFP